MHQPSIPTSREPAGLLVPFTAATLAALAAIAGLAAAPSTTMLLLAITLVAALLVGVTALVLHALGQDELPPASPPIRDRATSEPRPTVPVPRRIAGPRSPHHA